MPIGVVGIFIATIFLFPTNFYLGGGEKNSRELSKEESVGNQFIHFPEDRGHHDSDIEWWYLNSHIEEVSTNTSYALMIFVGRLGSPNKKEGGLFLGLTNLDTGEFSSTFLEGKLETQKNKLHISFQDFDNSAKLTWLESKEGHSIVSIDSPIITTAFSVVSEKPIVFMNGGVVPISDSLTSFYYSYPRLSLSPTTSSSIKDESSIKITGEGWFDHQWFDFGAPIPANLNSIKVDHEWFSVQLKDNRELVFWQAFKNNTQTLSYMALVDKDGTRTDIESFTITPMTYWITPSGSKYAKEWRIVAEDFDIDLIVETSVLDQLISSELTFRGNVYPFSIYEGAIRISGAIASEEVEGYGYAELTHTY